MGSAASRAGGRILAVEWKKIEDPFRFTDMASRLAERGRDVYDRDEALRLASEAVLHKIGEAVGRLPMEAENIRRLLERLNASPGWIGKATGLVGMTLSVTR